MKPTAKKLSAAEADANKRLDIFVSEKLAVSRSQAQKMIADGLVSVNGKLPKKAGGQVKDGNIVVIARSEERATRQSHGRSVISARSTGSENQGIASSPRERLLAMTPRVIAATPDYLVVNKPTGLIVHPTQANETNTLVNFLVKKYPEIKKVGDDPTIRPGIVHRLDKEASGLLVVARTQPMFNHLKDQFKHRTVEKEYWALAHGRVAKDWDEITFPIARSETFDRMAARPLTQRDLSLPSPLPRRGGGDSFSPPQRREREERSRNGEDEKDAKTEFFVEKRFVNFTLLKIILHTGRMHQIRVHLLAYNHPLVGDPLYNQKKRKRAWDEKLGRLFLHSAKLSFTDLAGQKQTFESPLPEELEEFLTMLK